MFLGFWPQRNIDIPDGLEDLLNIDKLFIDERLDGIDGNLLEIIN